MSLVKKIIKSKKDIRKYESVGDIRSLLIEQSYLRVLEEKKSEEGNCDRENLLRKVPTM